MKITLHIGYGKTGTTAIQHFLRENSCSFWKNKSFVTTLLDNIPTKTENDICHHKVFSLEDKDLIREKFTILNEILYKNRIKHFIWSLESLVFSNLEEIEYLKKLLQFSEIEFIVFLRRQ